MTTPYSASTANNARLLEPDLVARLFVQPPFFRDLFSIRHQLLVGPRGSGKTTLLKMLRLPALDHWQGIDGDLARENIPFASIFIPADVSWTGRLRSQVSVLPAEVDRAYTRAAVSLLVRRAILEGFAERCRKAPSLSRTRYSQAYAALPLSTHQEVSLCKQLAKSWGLDEVIPTLRGLRSAISGAGLALKKTLDHDVDRGEWANVALMAQAVSAPIVETVTHSIDIFEEIVGVSSSKWAVLFDELEITPQWFQEEVLRRFRSTDQRLVFKAAITPCGEAASHVGALTQAHRVDDYEEIPLWYSDTRDAGPFCEAFWNKLIEGRGLPRLSPEAVFGSSISDDFEPIAKPRSGRYQRRGVWFKKIEALAKRDPSFSDYLKSRGVDIRYPDAIPREKMDSVIRKVGPIAFYREYFLDDLGQSSTHRRSAFTRSRKIIALYSGAKIIFRVTEGNPRWYLSLVGELLDTWLRQGRSITRQQQARMIVEFSDRFLATVAAYPNPRIDTKHQSNHKLLTVTRLIDKLGTAAFYEIVGPKFTDDPRLSVRADVDDVVVESLLNVAINAGALVLIRDSGAPNFITAPHGRTFRLSYQLAPRYRIPLRVGRHVSLSRVLSVEGPRIDREHSSQIPIFE